MHIYPTPPPWAPLAAAALLAAGLTASPDDADARRREAAEDAPVVVEAEIGLFFARLSAGITNVDLDITGDSKTSVDRAIDSIGTGSGNVGQLAGRVQLFGHDLFFSYVSDDIFEAGNREVIEDRLGNKLAEDALMLLAGELKPDIQGLITDDDQPYVRVQYGKLEGVIEDPWRFATRNGRPWFPGRNGAKWETSLLTLEAGALYEETERSRYKKKTERTGFGYFLRYTSFERPVVIGFGSDDGRDFGLQDGGLTVVAFGVRYLLETCETTCWTVQADTVPFTGLSFLDLGPFGDQSGGILTVAGNLRWSWPIEIGDLFIIEPFAAFQIDYLLPLIGNYFSAEINDADLWAPDYLLWGPSLGLIVEI